MYRTDSIMQYSVPQFIDVEDKVIGPLSVRQFMYIVVAGMVLFLLWAITGISILFIILAIPILLIFGSLAFLKINGRPFQYYLFSVAQYMVKGTRLWIWKREGVIEKMNVQIETADKKDPASKKFHVFPKTRIQKLSEVLDSGLSVSAAVDIESLRIAARMRVREKELERYQDIKEPPLESNS